jgi:drug/metabolite transporter (DMT)-like permease
VSGRPDSKARWALAGGLASLSFAAILVRYCAAPALAIGFYRKAFASLLLLPVLLARLRKEPWDGALQKRLLPYTMGAGLILGLHFACWIGSIQLTTVASSLLVMSAQPVWAGLLGYLFLKEPVPRRGVFAIALSLLGVGFIAWGDLGRGWESLMGDGLALLSGIAAAAYLTVGRHLRTALPLIHYLLTVYAASALCLGLAAVAARQPLTGFDGRTWLMFGLLAFFPSFLGHSLVNYAIRHMEAYRVNLSILVEPVVSTALAALLFAEIPGSRFYLGAVLVFGGVMLALWQPGGKPPSREPTDVLFRSSDEAV